MSRPTPTTRRLALAPALATLLACAPAEAPPSEAQPAQVRVAEVVLETFEDDLRLPATIEAWQIAVLVPDIPGRVHDVRVRIGDEVDKGDLLVTLEAELLEQGVAESQASLRLAEAQLGQARSQHQRMSELHETGAIADARFEEVAVALELAEAQAQQARAGLEVARARLADTRLEAPFSGVVVARNLEPGELVGGPAQRPPLQVADLSRVRATTSVGELDVARVQTGQAVEVVVDALPGRTFSGTVERVNAAVDPVSRTVRVEAVLDNPGGVFKHGMTAEMRLGGAGVAALSVPRIALLDASAGAGRVLVLQDGEVVSRRVRYGASRNDRVPIESGLQAGEQVLVAGHTRLREGAPVEVVGSPP